MHHCILALYLHAGTSSDSSSRPALPQQQQQQQQAAAWAQAPQWRQQAGMTGQAAPAAAANSGVAAVPSLDHPSTIPLHLEDGTVKDAAGNVLLEQLSSLASLNVRQSKHGALVFGAASQHGPACCWDVTVGKVSRYKHLDALMKPQKQCSKDRQRTCLLYCYAANMLEPSSGCKCRCIVVAHQRAYHQY
jgi:hypothetical protein